jgi:hypothetical protein
MINTEDLVVATKKMGLEAYAEKTKHIRGQVSRSECRIKSQHKEG